MSEISGDDWARLVRNGGVIHWEASEEDGHAYRLKACAERRKQWGEDDCEEKDGSCQECRLDMAEHFAVRLDIRPDPVITEVRESAPDPLEGMPGMEPYSHEEFSRDCDRLDGR